MLQHDLSLCDYFVYYVVQHWHAKWANDILPSSVMMGMLEPVVTEAWRTKPCTGLLSGDDLSIPGGVKPAKDISTFVEISGKNTKDIIHLLPQWQKGNRWLSMFIALIYWFIFLIPKSLLIVFYPFEGLRVSLSNLAWLKWISFNFFLISFWNECKICYAVVFKRVEHLG